MLVQPFKVKFMYMYKTTYGFGYGSDVAITLILTT